MNISASNKGRYGIDFDECFEGLMAELAKRKGVSRADIFLEAISAYAYLVGGVRKEQEELRPLVAQGTPVPPPV
jgi:hypothetical protein